MNAYLCPKYSFGITPPEAAKHPPPGKVAHLHCPKCQHHAPLSQFVRAAQKATRAAGMIERRARKIETGELRRRQHEEAKQKRLEEYEAQIRSEQKASERQPEMQTANPGPIQIYCPACETPCSQRATTCPKCAHPLAARFRDKAFPKIVQMFSFLVTPKKLKMKAAIVALGVCAVAPFVWSWTQWGTLPDPVKVQAELGVWMLPEAPAILRGRPLTQIPFTSDASKTLDAPTFSLYRDDNDKIVAFTASMSDYPNVDDDISFAEWSLSAMVDSLKGKERNAFTRYKTIRSFASFYLGSPPLRIDEVIAYRERSPHLVQHYQKPPEFEGDTARKQSWFFGHHQFDIELMVLDGSMALGAGEPTSRSCLWIVKSRDW